MPERLIGPDDFAEGNPPRITGFEIEYDTQHLDERYKREKERSDITHDQRLLLPNAFKGAGIIAHDLKAKTFTRWIANGGKIHLDVGRVEHSSGEFDNAYSMAAGKVASTRLIADLCSVIPGAQAYLHAGTSMNNEEGDNRTRTLGAHDNHQLPRATALAKAEVMPGLLDSFDATRIWSWGGMVGPDGYELSQKALGVGGPTLPRMGIRTREKDKSMGWIHVGDQQSIHSDIDSPDWVRSERRVRDILFSRVATFIGDGMDSAILRILEHSGVLPKIKYPLSKLIFHDPVNVLRRTSHDLTMQQTYRTTYDDNITALNMQERVNDYLCAINKEIPLPDDESEALKLHRTVCERLAKSNVIEGDLQPILGWVDFAPRLAFLLRKHDLFHINTHENKVVQRSIKWGSLVPKGPGHTYWQHLYDTKQAPDPIGEPLIEYCKEYPSTGTRAAVRGRIVRDPTLRSRITYMGWEKVVLNGNVLYLNPYQSDHEDLHA